MPIHRLQASCSSWVSGRSSRTFALIRCILLSSFSSFSFCTFAFSPSFLFFSSFSNRVWRTRKATKVSSWTTSPPRSGRATCGTGAVLTVRTPGRGVFCPRRASYSAFFLNSSPSLALAVFSSRGTTCCSITGCAL